MEIYDQIIKDYSEFGQIGVVHFNKGICLYYLKRFEDALEVFLKITREDKKYVKAFYYAGLAYANLQKFE